MEALAKSVLIPNFPEQYYPPNSCSNYKQTRIGWSLNLRKYDAENSSTFLRLNRSQALSGEASGSRSDETEENGFGIDVSNNDDILISLSHDDLSQHGESSENPSKINMPITTSQCTSNGAGGTRAGLFRTPISGGVQSATSAHGLPRPALAVRNLMEQARFAHLCTVMSRMHHRREGYPFGSLVDFAPDSSGHPIFSFSPLAIHTRNLLADPRCTLVVQIPGWSGLSNARVTIFGDVYPLPEHQQQFYCRPRYHKQELTVAMLVNHCLKAEMIILIEWFAFCGKGVSYPAGFADYQN